MTPEERERIRDAATRAAAAAPPLTPAQRDRLNAIFRPAIRAVIREHEEESHA